MINNSDLESDKTFGILHKAEMITQNQYQERIVNSMMLYLKFKFTIEGNLKIFLNRMK